ncbi:MAG: methyltransferase domain-containing protein [Candidatus Rokubacteria bacterium]|nr:methyltransferase domain-containing protein [Candidatus Rokubacteria bacterium]
MPTSSSLNEDVKQRYTRPDLGTVILTALASAGKDLDALKPEDLAPIDEFHIRGRQATLELAQAAGVDASQYVLDVGSGIGGPSRCLAREFGCRVAGIDLTDEYCRVATMLAERIRLSRLVSYRQGDALNLPFPDAVFDVVWSQHVAMNIPDKARLYGEMYRVLKPGGALAIYDILAGPAGPALFPVPWACVPGTSFLVTPDELHQLLEASGFNIASWEDTTTPAREWFTALAKKIQQHGLPPLGFHLIFGPDFRVMAENQVRNLEEGRIVLGQVVARK